MARADSKKRKRISESNVLPPAKLQRASSPPPHRASDAPIHTQHATMILDILEMIDTQGLLDRVFPVLDLSSWLSLRTLLEQFHQHPLKLLRSAVQHLLPLSSEPRASQSPTAAQQLRFCNLALSLLDQASFHTVPVPLSLSSILQEQEDVHSPVVSKRKYALLQHLPTGDYWTSLSSDTTAPLKDLPQANAELVAILPTPLETTSKPVPTLGSYKPPKPLPPPKPIPPQRRVTTCDFLDYGVWSSFAPAFDHDAQVVGPTELGEVIYAWEERRRDKIALWREQREGTGIIEEVVVTPAPSQDVESELEELLPPDQVQDVKAALASLELENAVQELLERNRLALIRLEELQRLRLLADGGGTSVAVEGSEEWDTAQGILDSLTVLASLRPRAIPLDPALQDESTSIMPPPSVLHKLHHTLALEPSPGWYGTLPATRTTALRDDNTIKVRSGISLPAATTAPTPAAAPTTTTAITATPVPVTTTPAAMSTTPYTGYTYQYGGTAQPQQAPQAYRPTGTPVPNAPPAYSSYKPPYYQYAPPQQGIQQSYYGHQQQGYGAAQFAGGWYNAYAGTVNLAANMSPVAVAQSGSGSAGRGTPQPQPSTQAQTQAQAQAPAIPAANGPTTYGAFFGAAQGPPPPPLPPGGAMKTPAVANTVSYAGAQVGGGAVPTLPVHLRSGQHFQQPLQQGSYYGAYQPPVAR